MEARAREWRRSRSNARAGEEAAGPRSDAPKSIASSLLVPADMVQTAITTAPSATAPAGQDGAVGPHASDKADAPSAAATVAREEHRNPFLAGADASAGAATGTPGRSWRARIWNPAVGLAGGVRRRVRTRHDLLAATPRQRAIPRAKPIVVALGVLGLIAIGVEIIAPVLNSSAPVRSTPSAVRGNPLERVTPALLSALGTAVGETRRFHRPRQVRSRRVRAHRATATHPRARTPAATAVAVRSTPLPRSSSSGSATGGSDESSGSTAGASARPTAQPVTASTQSTVQPVSASTQSTVQPVSASTQSTVQPVSASAPSTVQPATSSSPPKTSAFGASGVLGPGSSPNG